MASVYECVKLTAKYCHNLGRHQGTMHILMVVDAFSKYHINISSSVRFVKKKTSLHCCMRHQSRGHTILPNLILLLLSTCQVFSFLPLLSSDSRLNSPNNASVGMFTSNTCILRRSQYVQQHSVGWEHISWPNTGNIRHMSGRTEENHEMSE
jgi:hypothetical protein